MKVLLRTGLVMLALFAAAPAAPARAIDERTAAEAIVTYYQGYLRRNPNRAEVEGWIFHMRQTGASLEQVEAGVLASRDYFAACNNSPRVWVGAAFADVFGRYATVREAAYLMDRLVYYLGDRTRVAEEILAAARGGGYPSR